MSPTATYRPRHPERTPLYQCLEDYWEEFKQSYPYFYEAEYGPWRPVVEKTVDRFLECGLLRHGFARLKCGRCSHQAQSISPDMVGLKDADAGTTAQIRDCERRNGRRPAPKDRG